MYKIVEVKDGCYIMICDCIISVLFLFYNVMILLNKTKVSTRHDNLVSQRSRVSSPADDLRFGFFAEQFFQRRVGVGKFCLHSFRKLWNIKGICASLESFKGTW